MNEYMYGEAKLIDAVRYTIIEVAEELSMTASSMRSTKRTNAVRHAPLKRLRRAHKNLRAVDERLRDCFWRLMPFYLENVEPQGKGGEHQALNLSKQLSVEEAKARVRVSVINSTMPVTLENEYLLSDGSSVLKGAIQNASEILERYFYWLSRQSAKNRSRDLIVAMREICTQVEIIHACRCAIARELKVQEWHLCMQDALRDRGL